MLRLPLACRAAGSGAAQPQGLTPRQRRLQKQKKKRQGERQQREGQQQPPPDLATASADAAAPAAAAACSTELGCPHFDACSGCGLSSVLEAPPVLQEAQRFFAEELNHPGFRLHAGDAHGWRRRARLAVRPGLGGRALIGLFAEGSHDVTPIPSCVVHHPAINAAVRLLEAAVAACGVQPYDEATGEGHLRYVQLTVVEPADGMPSPTSTSGGGDGSASMPGSSSPPASSCTAQVQLALVWNSAPYQEGSSGGGAAGLAALAGHLWQAAGGGRSGGSGLLHSVWANFQPERTNTIFGPEWRLLHGAELAWARVGGADICFGPGSFLQANFGAMDAALAAMARQVPPGATICDLHAGVGTIGLSLAATCAPRWVRCVEINGQGRPPFQHSVAHLRQQWQAREAAAPSGRSSDSSGSTADSSIGSGEGSLQPPPALEYTVAAAGADPGRWCAGAEVVVCDPPRKGLEPQLLHWLCSPAAPAAGVRRLLYLSCGFPALQRDSAALVASGRWRLAAAEAFLFFPGSNHIETLAVFDAA